MAFNKHKLYRSTAGVFGNSSAPVSYIYDGLHDTQATILADDYFLAAEEIIATGALIQFQASDNALTLAKVTASSVSTVTLENLVSGSATIPDGSITRVKLAAGLAPIAALIHTTVGGSTSEDITIAGLIAGDVVLCNIDTEGATPVTIKAAVADAGKVVVTFSADPSTDHKISVVAFKAYTPS